jgi:hypothetical protein
LETGHDFIDNQHKQLAAKGDGFRMVAYIKAKDAARKNAAKRG